MSALDELVDLLASTAAERDRAGGTARRERDAIRQSGLLALSVPRELGGAGAGWAEVQRAVRALARVDGSLAHLFGFHHLLLATVRLFGHRGQWSRAYQEAVDARCFWGNALNPLDPRTQLRRVANGWRLAGVKSFASGASDSDRLVVSALREDTGKLAIAFFPTARPGVRVLDDWDAFGQRQTDSGTVELDDVEVADDELLVSPGPLGSVFASLRPCIAQLVLVNVYLGLAEGAFAEARRSTATATRPRAAGAPPVAQDPYVLHRYGQMFVALEGARLLADRAGEVLEAAWQRGDELDVAGRGDVAIAVATAKVAATQVGLDVTAQIFDVTSARAAGRTAGLDRYWRNLRVHSLHDPVDYKLRELGDFALNAAWPTPSFYS